MSAKKQHTRSRGKGGNSRFVMLPAELIFSRNWSRLSGSAVRLLVELLSQLRFDHKTKEPNNNGDLCATMSVLSARGWRSSDTLRTALAELEHYGFIEKSRQGAKRRCNLFAVTNWPVNECSGKLDIGPTRQPKRLYREERPEFKASEWKASRAESRKKRMPALRLIAGAKCDV